MPIDDRTDAAHGPEGSVLGEQTSQEGAPLAEPELLAPGTEIGPYMVVDTLGAGAMGVVYAAHDRRLDRRVAIKMVRAAPGEASKGAPRLLREAQALAKLSHPNVVPVFDVGQWGHQVFLAMELVDGQDLRHWLGRRPRRWQDVLDVLVGAGRGLAAAHAAGIIHRDVKPDNVLLDRSGRARMTDFGLARGHHEVEPDSGTVEHHDSLSATLTRTGSVVGTPSYMSPEQHAGTVTDARADQYGFCVTLYEALYGERPFVGRDLQDLAHRKWTETMGSGARRSGIPKELLAILVRGMKRDPAQRFADMDELLAALVRVRNRRDRRWQLGLGLAAATAFGSWAWAVQAEPCPEASARMQGAWDDARRERVRDAFAAAKTAAATEAWPRTQAALDDFAARWVRAHGEICQAARAGRGEVELDAGMLCLAQRRARLVGVVDVLEEGERRTVHAASEIVDGLGDPFACRGATGSGTTDASRTREHQRLREAHAVADVRLGAGQYGTARELANALAREAKAEGDSELELEARLTAAFANAKSGRNDDAEAEYAAVFWSAQALGLDDLALRAATHMVFVLGIRDERADEGFVWARHAEAQLERLGEGEGLRRAKLLENSAWLYEAIRQEARSEQVLRDALAIRLRLESEDAPAVSMVRNNLALRLADRGAFEEALELHRVAHRNRVARLGPMHPDVAMSLINEARPLTQLGRGADALGRLAEAEPIVRASLGGQHPMLDAIWGARGAALLELGQFDAARAFLQLSLAHKLLSDGPDSARVGHMWNAIAVTYHQQRDWSRALYFFDRAQATFAAAGAPGEEGVAYVLSNRSTSELGAGNTDAALASAERALAIFRRLRPEDHPEIALALTNLAQVAVARDALDFAETTLARAEAIPVAGPSGRLRMALIASLRERIAWKRRGWPRDAATRLQGLREQIAAIDPYASELVAIDAWLAQAHAAGSADAQ